MECRNRTVVPTRLPSYATEMEHDGRTYTVTVSDLDVSRCTSCGAMALGDEALDRLSDALRQTVGLLAPSEIRARREALGLTQKELAGLLQISESTLCRWETGAQYQQRCMDRLLRGFFEVPEFRQFTGWEAQPSSALSSAK
jgi:putative zinc finger/helix-turn-helix YgiT family protein